MMDCLELDIGTKMTLLTLSGYKSKSFALVLGLLMQTIFQFKVFFLDIECCLSEMRISQNWDGFEPSISPK